MLGTIGISAWLFGGWGLDARIGHITREHGDVEFWVDRADAERSKSVLITAGATALATQPPTESCEFTWNHADFSTAYFDPHPDGGFSQPAGRWSDWLFPADSFTHEPVILDGSPVLAMSIAGMLAMKEQYPHLRNGGPWRPKDVADIETLRRLAAAAGEPSGTARADPRWDEGHDTASVFLVNRSTHQIGVELDVRDLDVERVISAETLHDPDAHRVSTASDQVEPQANGSAALTDG